MKRSVLLPCLVHIEPRGLVYFKKKKQRPVKLQLKGSIPKDSCDKRRNLDGMQFIQSF